MVEIRYCGYCHKMITDEDQAYYHKPWYTWYCSLDHAIADGAFKAVRQSMEVAEQTTEVLSLIRDRISELQRGLDCLKTDIQQLKVEITKLKGG